MLFERQIPTAELILGDHSNRGMNTLTSALADSTRKILKTQETGTVLIAIEEALSPYSVSNFARNMIKRGTPPSKAYETARYRAYFGIVPFNFDPTIFTKERIATGELTSGDLAVYETLDTLFREFPTRIDVMWEGTNKDPEKLDKEFDKYEKLSIDSQNMVRRGKIKEGGQQFQQYAIWMNKLATDRDSSLAKDITKATQDSPGIIGITGIFGAAHSTLGHKLRESGIRTNLIVPEQYEDGSFVHDPLAVLVRTLTFIPAKIITPVDFQIYAIGQTACTTFQRQGDDDQVISRKSYGVMRLLNDSNLSSVAQQIKKNGFDQALQTLMSGHK